MEEKLDELSKQLEGLHEVVEAILARMDGCPDCEDKDEE